MNRTLLSVAAVLGTLSVLLVGSAIKSEDAKSAEENGSKTTDMNSQPLPEHPTAQALFQKWQANARINGEIPGGQLRSLAQAAENFVKYNPTDERAPKLAELLRRIDMSRDWTQAEAAALLDDTTDIYDELPKWAEDLQRFSIAQDVRTGQPLPQELNDAPWGETQPNGLRVAWLLEPRAKQHHLNTPLTSRILFHNAGRKDSVVFRLLTWNQPGPHKAHDTRGEEIKISSVMWTTIPQIVVCRLAPGEYTEVMGAGIGVGADRDEEDWRGTRVGSWIEAKADDEVTFTPAPVQADGNDGRLRPADELPWWHRFITNRLDRDAPLPADAAERTRLLGRAVRDLFGTPPTPEETAAFVTDLSPRAMEALAKRLARRAGTSPFIGTTLQAGETRFRILPVDPKAANKPRTATGPGRYKLGNNVQLVIVRKGRVNEAHIRFFSPDPKADPLGKPHEIKLPDGYLTWAIAWERGPATMLWATQKGLVRKIDFSDPANVKETRLDEPYRDKMPKPIFDALMAALGKPD